MASAFRYNEWKVSPSPFDFFRGRSFPNKPSTLRKILCDCVWKDHPQYLQLFFFLMETHWKEACRHEDSEQAEKCLIDILSLGSYLTNNLPAFSYLYQRFPFASSHIEPDLYWDLLLGVKYDSATSLYLGIWKTPAVIWNRISDQELRKKIWRQIVERLLRNWETTDSECLSHFILSLPELEFLLTYPFPNDLKKCQWQKLIVQVEQALLVDAISCHRLLCRIRRR